MVASLTFGDCNFLLTVCYGNWKFLVSIEGIYNEHSVIIKVIGVLIANCYRSMIARKCFCGKCSYKKKLLGSQCKRKKTLIWMKYNKKMNFISNIPVWFCRVLTYFNSFKTISFYHLTTPCKVWMRDLNA